MAYVNQHGIPFPCTETDYTEVAVHLRRIIAVIGRSKIITEDDRYTFLRAFAEGMGKVGSPITEWRSIAYKDGKYPDATVYAFLSTLAKDVVQSGIPKDQRAMAVPMSMWIELFSHDSEMAIDNTSKASPEIDALLDRIAQCTPVDLVVAWSQVRPFHELTLMAKLLLPAW